MISLRVSNELGTREKNMVADILAKQTHVSNTTSMEWEELPPSIKDSPLLDLSTLPCVRIISEGCPIPPATATVPSSSLSTAPPPLSMPPPPDEVMSQTGPPPSRCWFMHAVGDHRRSAYIHFRGIFVRYCVTVSVQGVVKCGSWIPDF
nr:hypothetical protein Iba_chr09aCG10020 [Ipomoea batatas]